MESDEESKPAPPHESADEQTAGRDPSDATGAKRDDNPPVEEGAGEKGAGSETGALGGLEGGTQPEGEDGRKHERP
jgi:hypothetical protein